MDATQTTAVVRELWPLLIVSDIERSVAFYHDRLGFTLARQATDSKGKIFWCRLERGGCSVMLQQAEEEEDGPAEGRGRGVIFYFICDDADVMYAELSGRGLRLDPPSVAYYGMKQVFVPEPDGYELCFESEV
jgi:uncharacterized glyoxalase superfamily protein PhnB